MWFSYFDDPGNFIPLSVDRVNEIIALNKEGEKPDDISVKKEAPKVKLPDFENVVGQDSLTRFDNAKKKKKKKKKKPAGNIPSANAPQTASAEKLIVQQNKPKPINESAKDSSGKVVNANEQPRRPNRNNNNRNRNNNNRPPKPPAEA
jgi:hypothetical protein